MRQPAEAGHAAWHRGPRQVDPPDEADHESGIRDDALIRWAAEQLRRREGDAALYSELISGGLDGRAWKGFAEALAIYGMSVMRAWIATGKINGKCAGKGWPIPSGWVLEQDDIESLATDVVLRALERFRIAARKGEGWRPDGGASLTTYFVEGCTNEYPNMHRSWRRRQSRHPPEEPTADPEELLMTAQQALLPDERLTDRDAVRQRQAHLLAGLAPRERELLLWHSHGYEPSEIAELLGDGTNPHIVQRQLRSIRAKVKRRHAACTLCGTAGRRSAS